MLAEKIILLRVNGFLGYEIFKYLSKKKKVIIFSKKKNKSFIKINYPKNTIRESYFDEVNTVIHLASLDRDQVKKNIKFSKEVNINFTEDLIDICIKKKVKNFIYFSSIGVYGENLKYSVDETTNKL